MTVRLMPDTLGVTRSVTVCLTLTAESDDATDCHSVVIFGACPDG